jgi:hypothetical protein
MNIKELASKAVNILDQGYSLPKSGILTGGALSNTN